ncbi:MAG: 30S ribosomal protein S9 [Candidatus Dojkabacteria bacterium]|nr:30S ribosomal protein S9 [Candidatus Dojkabacteria bacterium]
MSKKEYFEGIGRRKTSTCRVRIYQGDETSTVNGIPVEEYFVSIPDSKKTIMEPLAVVELTGKYYFTAKVNGGGTTGQLEAIQLGLARALYKMDENLKPELRKAELVTRDPRAVERKKYHHKKARKKPQFSKR